MNKKNQKVKKGFSIVFYFQYLHNQVNVQRGQN